MPSGQPMSSWSATAFCPVFGESAARTLLVYRMGPSFCCRPPPKIDSVLNFGGLGQPFRASRSRQRSEPPPFLKEKEKNSTDITPKNPNQAIVSSDNDDFPLPIPVVKRKSPRFSLCPIAREQCATHDAELIFMNEEPLATLLKTFPHTRYYPEWRLVTWHPRGLFDDALADKISGVIGTSIVCNHRGVRRFADGARNHF